MARKSLCTVLTVFLLVTFPFGFSSAESNKQYIKVGLAFGDAAASSCVLRSDSGFVLARAVSDGFEEVLRLPGSTELTVSVESLVIVAKDNYGQIVFDRVDADICLMPFDYTGGILRYNGKPYRGGFCFYITASGKMNIINYIDIESYLYGVLNSEMGYKNPMEALKAQAVTARSFTVCNTGKHKSEGFDLCTAVHCQVYTGYAGEYRETNRAVDETAGLVLTYGGETVSGYYFKNSGGHTQSVSDVWGGSAPYLTGTKDEYSPEYSWRFEIKFQDIGDRLKAAELDVGNVRSVAVKTRNKSGAVSSLEITGASGTVELKGESIRTIFGSANVKSRMFSFGGTDSVVPDEKDVMHIIGAGGKTASLKRWEVYVYPGRLLDEVPRVGIMEASTSDPLVFYGKGYGHGVGMPQDSAIEMAKKGFVFEEILKYFYTGIEIGQEQD